MKYKTIKIESGERLTVKKIKDSCPKNFFSNEKEIKWVKEETKDHVILSECNFFGKLSSEGFVMGCLESEGFGYRIKQSLVPIETIEPYHGPDCDKPDKINMLIFRGGKTPVCVNPEILANAFKEIGDREFSVSKMGDEEWAPLILKIDNDDICAVTVMTGYKPDKQKNELLDEIEAPKMKKSPKKGNPSLST